MKLSSPRIKSLTVTAGLSFWFFIITFTVGLFSLELFIVFVSALLIITQIFSSKISKALDLFSIVNTKFFLGALFVTVISIYGILFKLLKIDLLRLKKQNKTYWQNIESQKPENLRRQY
tara:strand:- start:268 stop:624 length:357 start_codon:yes stop_codon:yes gene_type:complete